VGLQKYRADEPGEPYKNGGVPWYSRWIGGPSLALIRNCATPFGPRTVYVTKEADTYFSLPAACKFKGRAVRGFVMYENESMVFVPYRNTWVYPHNDKDFSCS
jgi:hypothetical protein